MSDYEGLGTGGGGHCSHSCGDGCGDGCSRRDELLSLLLVVPLLLLLTLPLVPENFDGESRHHHGHEADGATHDEGDRQVWVARGPRFTRLKSQGKICKVNGLLYKLPSSVGKLDRKHGGKANLMNLAPEFGVYLFNRGRLDIEPVAATDQLAFVDTFVGHVDETEIRGQK